MISKDGHLGVVARTGKPIQKMSVPESPQKETCKITLIKNTDMSHAKEQKVQINGKFKLIKSK